MKQELEKILAMIRQAEGPACLLLHGDDFQVQEATKAILDLLTPAQSREFNLERFDGRVAPWDEIEASLMTPPLFAHKKTVLVENAPYFFSREHKEELGEKVLRLWGEGKEDEAARLFLDLLVSSGWNQERWEKLKAPLASGELKELFGSGGSDAKEEAEALLEYCQGKGWRLNQRQGGEEKRLMEFLENGLPPWDLLLMTAAHVDRRNRLYKRFDAKGAAIDFALAREKSGRISREVLTTFVGRRLEEAGKKIEPPALEMILARAGVELWAVHQELEKLLLYAGEKPWIRVADVEQAFLDLGEGWIFDLTKSIADRDALAALGHLARLLAQGDHPLRLLGVIASEVRRFLAARQFLEGELGQSWRREMNYEQFQRSVLKQGPPLITRNPYADYLAFKNAERFTIAELLRALERIYQADIRLKSSSHPPRLVMESLLLEMCQKK